MDHWIESEQKLYMPVARRQPIVITRGQGTRVWDQNNIEYLDFTAGWAVNNLGHCPPVMVQAIQEQAATLMQTSNQFYTIPQLQLAELLIDNSCLDKIFLCNSGAEANEGAIKLARKYGKMHLNGAYEIITTENSFHGRTLTTTAATGNTHYQENFLPMTPGFTHVPFNDFSAIESAVSDQTCAVFLEPLQGEGGVNVPSATYLQDVRRFCQEKGILFILDEVQTGMGRLGTLFGYQYYNAEPDVMTLAKGLGGGVPIGAFLCKDFCDVLRPGDHGSTFGGNALTCAAAHAVVQYTIDHEVPQHARETGDLLKGKLNAVKARHETAIKEIRGTGMLLAVEFHEEIGAAVVAGCNEARVLLNPVRPNLIRFMPPLTLSIVELDEGVARFERGLISALSSSSNSN